VSLFDTFDEFLSVKEYAPAKTVHAGEVVAFGEQKVANAARSKCGLCFAELCQVEQRSSEDMAQLCVVAFY
jgi:hypothetical protein